METKIILDALNREPGSGKNAPMDMKAVVDALNRILEMELAGVVLYTHFSFVVFGSDRMPIVKWMSDQAAESMTHAQTAGELITQFGCHPSMGIAPLVETQQHDTNSVLRECLAFEKAAMSHYCALLQLVEGRNVMMEEFCRTQIYLETRHIGEVDKMLRQQGDMRCFDAA